MRSKIERNTGLQFPLISRLYNFYQKCVLEFFEMSFCISMNTITSLLSPPVGAIDKGILFLPDAI